MLTDKKMKGKMHVDWGISLGKKAGTKTDKQMNRLRDKYVDMQTVERIEREEVYLYT